MCRIGPPPICFDMRRTRKTFGSCSLLFLEEIRFFVGIAFQYHAKQLSSLLGDCVWRSQGAMSSWRSINFNTLTLSHTHTHTHECTHMNALH